jgi:hypothetical protein
MSPHTISATTISCDDDQTKSLKSGSVFFRHAISRDGDTDDMNLSIRVNGTLILDINATGNYPLNQQNSKIFTSSLQWSFFVDFSY